VLQLFLSLFPSFHFARIIWSGLVFPGADGSFGTGLYNATSFSARQGPFNASLPSQCCTSEYQDGVGRVNTVLTVDQNSICFIGKYVDKQRRSSCNGGGREH
jgi:hypothetical protein